MSDEYACPYAVTGAVDCPTCQAPIGVPCFTKNGNPSSQPHARRIACWREQMAQESEVAS